MVTIDRVDFRDVTNGVVEKERRRTPFPKYVVGNDVPQNDIRRRGNGKTAGKSLKLLAPDKGGKERVGERRVRGKEGKRTTERSHSSKFATTPLDVTVPYIQRDRARG